MIQSRVNCAAVAVVAALLFAACGADEVEGDGSAPLVTSPGAVDLSLRRDDVDCAEDMLDPGGVTTFSDAHYVVGGVLGAPCFGDGDETLIDAWNVLAAITPTMQLADLGLFGAFAEGEAESPTLAFVNILDSDGTLFQMSINLEEYLADPTDAVATMAHEFSRVFTAIPSRIDRSDGSDVNCATYDNGEGCYRSDSLMAQWIELFWGDGLIDQVDPFVEPTGDEGVERCDADAGFLGSYAASNPEEDFAETFGAYVSRLEAPSPEVQAKLDWIDAQPGLAEFRDRAIAADLGPIDNNFEECGLG